MSMSTSQIAHSETLAHDQFGPNITVSYTDQQTVTLQRAQFSLH